MKITRKTLKRLAQEELDAVLTEIEVKVVKDEDVEYLKPIYQQIKDNLLDTAEDTESFRQAFQLIETFHEPGQRMGREFVKWLFSGALRKILALRREARSQKNYNDEDWGNLMDELWDLKRRIRTGIVDNPQV